MKEQKSNVDETLRIRRHHLPHWQQGGSTYFVTFRSARDLLSREAQATLSGWILAGHGLKYSLIFGVIMPDHVHLLLRPLQVEKGKWFDLSSIMKSIKGGSSRAINRRLGTSGTVWQKESFDRIVRDEEELLQKWNYMYLNPFKSGIVDDPDEYDAFVRPDDSPEKSEANP